jgi:hypothetical protein
LTTRKEIEPEDLEALRRGVDQSWNRWLSRFVVFPTRKGSRLFRLTEEDYLDQINGVVRGYKLRGRGRTINELEEQRVNCVYRLCTSACSPSASEIDRLVFRMFVGRVSITSREYIELRNEAETSGDANFFNGVAGLFKVRFLMPFEHPAMDRLAQLLLTRWDVRTADCPELFRLRREGLSLVCNRLLGANHLNPEAVRKLRFRLNLPVIRSQKVEAWLHRGKLQFREGDKNQQFSPHQALSGTVGLMKTSPLNLPTAALCSKHGHSNSTKLRFRSISAQQGEIRG